MATFCSTSWRPSAQSFIVNPGQHAQRVAVGRTACATSSGGPYPERRGSRCTCAARSPSAVAPTAATPTGHAEAVGASPPPECIENSFTASYFQYTLADPNSISRASSITAVILSRILRKPGGGGGGGAALLLALPPPPLFLPWLEPLLPFLLLLR